MMNGFRDVIDAWPSRGELATDLGVRYGNVKQMHRRESIPAGHWERLLAGAKRRRIPLTERMLIAFAAQAASRTHEGEAA